jgi:SAM-dependent methyltransferase
MGPRIDFSQFADIYDLAPYRSVRTADANLSALVQRRREVRVLDLGCGTGSYLCTQSNYFGSATFIGLDYSYDMLAKAKSKGVVNVFLANVDEGIPLGNAVVDYVSCRFAFHHFLKKAVVLGEVRRCLRVGGMLSIYNVEPYSNCKWWVYDLFPEVIAADLERFWKPELLVESLVGLGFNVECRVDRKPEILTKGQLLGRLRMRDTSQLHMVEEELFALRLQEVAEWPEDKVFVGDSAFLSVNALKG